MRVLVISDTHGKDENLNKVLEMEKNRDMLFHLGDIEGREGYISLNSNCPCYMVAGNNDYFSPLKNILVVDVGSHKVLLTHGHHFYVSLSTEYLKAEAIAQGCDIVMYGHTHKPEVDVDDEVTVVNPGSLSYPRQEGRLPSYVIMEIDDETQEVHYTIRYLNK